MTRQRLHGIAGLGLLLGLLVIASFAFAQTTIHKNAFETKIGWSKGSFDTTYEETAHRIDDREPHNGQGSEYIELDVKQAKENGFIRYVYPVGKAPIANELRIALWMRANRPGLQVMARVVLPNERDPNNLGYSLTTYIRGDMYQQTGRWQLLEIGRPVALASQQQQLMNVDTKRSIDFTGAYIDALVLNLNGGPGPTKVWIDDLEIGPVVSGASIQPAVRPDNNNPKMGSIPSAVPPSVVGLSGSHLTVNNKRIFFRAIRYTDTMLSVLKEAGFNTICFDRNVKPALVKEAADLGLWIVPEFRVTSDDGLALAPEDITNQMQRYADNDAVLFRRIGGLLSYEQSALVARGLQTARTVDVIHPIAADVWDGMLPYSRSINLVNVHRWPLMTTMEMSQYRAYLDSRRKLANPGIFTWTWIQTHLPDSYSTLLYNQNAQAEFKDPVGPQPEQIRLLAYNAIASGCRGLGFWSDRFLADSHQGRDRLLCCALLNQEIEMMEALLVTVEDVPQWIDTSSEEIKAAVLRCNQGVLVIPIWQGRFAQFVPGQAAAKKLVITVPQVPVTTQAWRISPGSADELKIERVDKGMKITLKEFGLTSMIVFTADPALMGKFQEQARTRRKKAAQWSFEMASNEYEKVMTVQTQLEQVGATLPDAHALLEDCKKRLQKSEDHFKAHDYKEAYHEAERALRPVRILMRAQWEKAVRGLDTPVASPYAVSFYTLPKHWPMMAEINKSSVGANVLPGGDFEVVPERVQEPWQKTLNTLDDVDLAAAPVTELHLAQAAPMAPAKTDAKDSKEIKKSPPPGQDRPKEGKLCAMLEIKPHVGKLAPPALERTLVALTSPTVKLAPGTLVQVSGWINIPNLITASPDGALMYDSAGGEPLAIRLTAPTPWKKFTVYRRVPASGTINVTLALTGVGVVYFDDIRIEPRIPPGGGVIQASGN